MVLRLTKSDSSHKFFQSNKKFANRSLRPTTPYRVAVGQLSINYTSELIRIIQHHESFAHKHFTYYIKNTKKFEIFTKTFDT